MIPEPVRALRATWFFVVLLCLALWIQSYQGRLKIWRQDVAVCREITIPGTKDNILTDTDVIVFANRAAEARDASGDHQVADAYRGIAHRAQLRVNRRKTRLRVPCADRFHKPTPWG